MGRIVRLSEVVANQIAAGEVVERPASVVKELVENAIDAGARRVTVELEAGGLGLIRVTDDGGGMSPDDAELCFERHATSKIRSAEDLSTVRTLGFRGEAIPSIAAVSRFVLTTRPADHPEATRVAVEGGAKISAGAVGAAPGTTVEVRDLFYNVPARKKFMKRPVTELGHVSETIERLALARPEIGVVLKHEARTLLEAPPASSADPAGRLARVLGKAVGGRLHPIPEDTRAHAIEVRGWVGAPELNERTPRAVHTFVNGRYVRDRTIQHAVLDAYRTLLERGRYPVVVVWIEMAPEHVDVNVHPQKLEVRFASSGDVHRAVSGALTRALTAQPWVPSHAPRPLAPPLPLSPLAFATSPAPRAGGAWSILFDRPAERTPYDLGPPAPRRSEGPPPPRPPEQVPMPEQRFGALEPVGQVLGTYLVCQGPGRVVLIDQHAAHERIGFERMRTQFRKGKVEVQPLLIPRTIELDPKRAAIADAEGARIRTAGFELEPFGGATWVLKSAPAALGQADLERVVLDVIDELADVGGSSAQEEAMDAIFSCAACHTVVRAGDRLGKDEIKALLVQMDAIDFGAHCPHGRPVFVEWSERELASLFHRT